MKNRTRNSQNSGFTLVEVLATVGILVILLGLATVGVIRYIDVLKIAELDNAAREIYMAAENRAVLLSNSQQLDSLVNGAGMSTTLSGNGHVGPSVGESDEADALFLAETEPETKVEELYYVYSTATSNIAEDLLPTGSIDPTLLNGDFYIVYDVVSGSVTDVFYAEKTKDVETPLETLVECNTNFETFYDYWAKERSVRLGYKNSTSAPTNNNKTLVGWYNGEAAEGGNYGPDVSQRPYVDVEIINGEELTVTLTVRGEYVQYIAVPGQLSNLTVRLGPAGDGELTDDNSIDLELPPDLMPSGNYFEYTWVVDSLETDEDGEYIHQFKDLGLQNRSGANFTPGGDFKVVTTITDPDTNEVLASDEDSNNSLFWKDSDCDSSGDAAYIKYLRHLQNLSADEDNPNGYDSGVEGKTSAVQVADVLGDNNETYPNYSFVPISNDALERYTVDENGQNDYYAIRNLTLKAADNASVGLFAQTKVGMTLDNIRLVNTKVSGNGAVSVGALAGKTDNAQITNCWVYWETDEVVTNLRETLKSGDQLTGKTVGGLVGQVADANASKTTISNSLAATMVNGTDANGSAGGLVGQVESGSPVISNSYADCYLTGSGKVAGLVGDVAAGKTVDLENCYAAGFIMGGSTTAGLCLGDGTTKATNVYSVMLCHNPDANDEDEVNTTPSVPLTENENVRDNLNNTYYLGNYKDDDKCKSYEEMAGDGLAKFVSQMNIGSDSAFESKGLSVTHPYNVLEELSLGFYDYPGLNNMPHYGDWGSMATLAKPVGLVYYEDYGDGDYGVSGSGIRHNMKNDGDGKTIRSDGYAAAFLLNYLPDDATAVTLKYTYGSNTDIEVTVDWSGGIVKKKTVIGETTEEETYTSKNDVLIPATWDGKEYYIIFLPDELVNNEDASEDFYVYLKIELDLGLNNNTLYEREFFFNPHFAETVLIPEDDWNSGGKTADNYIRTDLAGRVNPILIRAPRHLYDLSRFNEYYNNANYVFSQQLDLDYHSYTGYGLFTEVHGTNIPYSQSPIGSEETPFRGTYYGNCLTIKHVIPTITQRAYTGLFGYSNGLLQDIVYEMDPDYPVVAYLGATVSASKYLGALAGGNAGTVRNCAVWGTNLQVSASGGYLYIGGLAGRNLNGGTIERSAAESALLSTNGLGFIYAYTGGFVGRNEGSVSYSYAVGHLYMEAAAQARDARICGFAGWNGGRLENSYAAVNLESGGGIVDTRGFTGDRDGDQPGAGYLNPGNYTYRGESYAANYERAGEKAKPIPYDELSKLSDTTVIPVSGMSWVAGDDTFPYPTAVTKNGTPVHYGEWPKPMDLGQMGVFYWEKMVYNGDENTATYYISALTAAPDLDNEGGWTITSQSTLPTAHDDGGAVVDYGYGYYADSAADVTFSVENIIYAKYANDRYPLDIKDSGQIDSVLNEALKSLMPSSDFVVYAWHTYREGPKPVELYTASEFRRDQATHGLAPNMSNGGPHPNDGAFILKQGDIEVAFTINPHFAASMGVKLWNGVKLQNLKGTELTTALENANLTVDTKWTVEPGTSDENPFQVRAGMQLQMLAVIDSGYFASPLGRQQGVTRFAYLTNDTYYNQNGRYQTGNYHLKQTHDLDWVAEGNILYVCTTPGCTDAHEYTSDDTKIANTAPYNDSPYGLGVRMQTSYVPSNKVAEHPAGHNLEVRAGVFYSIASVHVRNNGNEIYYNKLTGETKLEGYFAGTYDGGNYVLKNFNIGVVNENIHYDSNCIGLFGAVKHATLKNIVLYSDGTAGTDTLTVLGVREGDIAVADGDTNPIIKNGNNEYSAAFLAWFREAKATGAAGADGLTYQSVPGWYAAGVLAGVALDSTIESCAVAGYTIKDQTQLAGAEVDGLGGAVGGLVGLTDSNLEGCTAVVNIELTKSHDGVDYGFDEMLKAIENSPEKKVFDVKRDEKFIAYGHVRSHDVTYYTADGTLVSGTVSINRSESPIYVGGLVGATTASVTNCYTGGEIELSNYYTAPNGEKVYSAGATVYVGRVVGGTGMVNGLGNMNSTTADISSSYSYLKLNLDIETENGAENELVTTFYDIGGTERTGGVVTLSNDYYLAGAIAGSAKTEESDGAQEVSYLELEGKVNVGNTEKTIYDLLNDGDSAYNPVTDNISGLAASGRFSHSPKAKTELQGRDYPFPTLLTQKRNDVPGGTAYVHYGEWPINGIHRDEGLAPVYLDMFTPLDGYDNPGYCEEALTLADGINTNGNWTVSWTVGGEEDDAEDPVISVSFSDTDDSTHSLTDTNGTASLYITAKKAVNAPVTVTVMYEVDGATYSLDITVYITANIRLTPEPDTVYIFPGEDESVVLTPMGTKPGTNVYDVELGGKLEIKSVKDYSGLLTAELINTDEGGMPGVNLTLTDALKMPAPKVTLDLEVTYTYTRNNSSEPVEKTESVRITVISPYVSITTDDDGNPTSVTVDFSGFKTEGTDELTVTCGETTLTSDGNWRYTIPLTGESGMTALEKIELTVKLPGEDGEAHTFTISLSDEDGTTADSPEDELLAALPPKPIDPDPVESEPKDPDLTEIEIPEPEEPENQTKVLDPEPEQTAALPPKPKDSEDQDADGSDPEPGEEPEP